MEGRPPHSSHSQPGGVVEDAATGSSTAGEAVVGVGEAMNEASNSPARAIRRAIRTCTKILYPWRWWTLTA